MKSIIEGIFKYANWSDRTGYGGPATPQSPNANIPSAQPLNSPNLFKGPNLEVDQCANLFGWQQQVVNILNNPKQDLYILSQAGSGKTAPVICHWVNKILNLSTSHHIDSQDFINFLEHPERTNQVLWLVPIRNLGVNIEEEMIQRFTAIILQIINRSCATVQSTTDPNSVDLIFSSSPNFNILQIISALSNYGSTQIRQILIGAPGQPNSGLIQKNTQMIGQNNPTVISKDIPEFKTNLGILVKSFVENALVGRIQEGWNRTKLGHAGGLKPFVISIYESASNIIDDFDKLRLIIFDEAQRIQGGSESDDKRAAQIGDSIHKVLFHHNGRNAQMIMLSGSTSSKTANNVIHYFNLAYDRRFENQGLFQTPEGVTNPADIRVFPMSGLSDRYKQMQIVKTALAGGNLRKSGIVFIIFGKNRINALIDQLVPTERGIVNPGKKLSTTVGSLYSKSDVDEITKPGEINDILDDRLRRAASHGLGFLYRPEELTPDREHDTKIIQNLFRNGTIKILFATDAVREGMNITCKEMYIPSILLPPDRRKMDEGSLAQLINRTGRKEGTYATIYTSPEFVGDITRALSKDSDRFGEQPFVLPMSAKGKLEAGLNYGANIPVYAAKDFYKAFRQAFGI
jgi:hypothetical protein